MQSFAFAQFFVCALAVVCIQPVMLTATGTVDVSVTVRYFACNDGIDNDGDLLIDYPSDTGCENAMDDTETDVIVVQCADGIDNDSDGRIDYPDDPGCDSVTDNNEINLPLSTGGSGGSSNRSTSDDQDDVIIEEPEELATVTFTGRAYPLSTVVILRDGEEVVRTIAGPDARFSVTVGNSSDGVYVFSAYAEDTEARRSTLFTTSLRLSENTETTISGVVLPPTVDTDKIEVRQGDDLALFGRTGPQASVVVEVNSRETQFLETVADDEGAYFVTIDTSRLEMGSHTAKAKEILRDGLSHYGPTISFEVGVQNVFRKERAKLLRGDLNNDGRVNMVDISVAAFWFKQPLSGSILSTERERLNGDTRIDFIDFSLIAFHWTG